MTINNDRQVLKLSELNLEVQRIIHNHFPENVWVIAEISEIKTNASGHCYLELIEKDPDTERIKARARATIWSYTFRMLKPYFETTTGYELKAGIKILVSVKVEFHEIYGYSLNITEIDPTYTLGDIERKRQEIISRLQKEGVMNMNKELPLPLVPQKIAVISSETAAGYKDFMNQLENNPYGYQFYCLLFPSIMQGDQAEAGIISAFEKIYPHEHFFDAVVIIRGGGSKADLSTFDNYNIAFHITQFPLPVLTGIGHEQDETIADMVSHLKLKTPTALAEFLIGRAHDFDRMLSQAESKLTRLVGSLIGYNHKLLAAKKERFIAIINMKLEHEEENLSYYPEKIGAVTGRLLDTLSNNIRLSFRQFVSTGQNHLRTSTLLLNNLISPLHPAIHNFLEMKRNQLNLYHQANMGLNPEKIFERGYSITLLKGKPVRDSRSVNRGDIIATHLHKGTLSSEVREKRDETPS